MKFKIKTKVVQEYPNQQYNQLLSYSTTPTMINVIKYDLLYEKFPHPEEWAFIATFATSQAAKDFAKIYGKNDSEEVFEV